MKTDLEGRPLLTQFSADGFIDCTFRIENLMQIDSNYKFHMSASFNDVVVGLNVEVYMGIHGGLDEELHLIQEHVYDKGIIFYRSGIESDNLINLLNSLYQLPQSNHLKMRPIETFTAIALHQGDLKMLQEEVRIKIFGRDQEGYDLDIDYYESFFNLDLKNGFVYWNEKDESYRESLIKGLSE